VATAATIACHPEAATPGRVCATPGLPLTAGSTAVVPGDTRAVRFTFDDTAPDTVTVDASALPLPGERCVLPCDPHALAAAELDAGSHPVAAGRWERVGTVDLPASGVIGATVDVLLGGCPDPLTVEVACDLPGPTRPTTVVAGQSGVPRDLWVADATGTLGAVATGDVVLPSFATGRSGAVTVDAHLVALGQVRTDPQARLPAAVGGQLTLAGTVTVRRWQTLTGYDQVQLTTTTREASPWLPSATRQVAAIRTDRLTPDQLCGDTRCEVW